MLEGKEWDRFPGRRQVAGFAKLVGGEVSEWLMVPLSKSGLVMSQRGFESHPLRRTGRQACRAGVLVLEGSHSWPSARDWKSRRR